MPFRNNTKYIDIVIIIVLNILTSLLICVMCGNLSVNFLGSFSLLNDTYIKVSIIVTIIIVLNLCWLFHFRTFVYVFLYGILLIQLFILISILYLQTVDLKSLILIDNFIQIKKYLTFEELFRLILKKKPAISLAGAFEIFKNLDECTIESLDNYLKKRAKGTNSLKSSDDNKKFLNFYVMLLLGIILFFRSLFYLLVLNARTSAAKSYYKATLNPLVNISIGIRLQIFAWFEYIEKSIAFKAIFHNNITRAYTLRVQQLVKKFIALDNFIKGNTPYYLRIFLEDKLFMFLYFLGIWSILWVKYHNSVESVLLVPALFAVLYSLVSFIAQLYVYIVKINFNFIENKKAFYVYITFPSWIIGNRLFFIYLFVSLGS